MLRKEERTAHRLLTEIKQEGRFGMKKLFQLVIMCFTALMLSACGTGGGESDEGIQIVESEPLDMAVSAEGEKAEDAEPLAGALINGGLPCAEVTFRTDAAEESIYRITGRGLQFQVSKIKCHIYNI